MKKSCLLLLVILAASSAGYWLLLKPTVLADKWWIPLLLGLGVTLVVTNFLGVFQALRFKRASLRPISEWKDGSLVCVSGRLTASDPVRAPFSDVPSGIVEYEIKHIVKSGDSSNTQIEYSGFLMRPCAIQTQRGAVKIIGFPLLAHARGEDHSDGDAFRRAGEFLTTTTFKEQGKNPLEALRELNAVLSDDDGIVNAHFTAAGSWLHKADDHGDDLEDDTESAVDRIAETSPAAKVVSERLLEKGFILHETAIKVGEEITIFGTFRKQKNAVDVGGGMQNISHQLHRGRSSAVVGKTLTKSLIASIVWTAITVAGNWWVLQAAGLLVRPLGE